MIKVDRLISSASASKKPKKRTSSNNEGGFSGLLDSSAPSHPEVAHAVIQAGSIGSLDALLSIQAVAPKGDEAYTNADKALNVLETLQHHLLKGEIPSNMADKLEQSLEQLKRSTTDPATKALIDDIALRVAVEIAKLSSTS